MDAKELTEATPLPVETRETLDRSLKHSHPTVRAKAAEAAARIRNPEVLPLLEPLLDDGDPRVRTAALDAFRQNAVSHGLVAASRKLQSVKHRALLVSIVRERNDDDTIPLLCSLFTAEPSTEVRLAILQTLATARDAGVVRTVLQAVIDPVSEIRHAAEIILRDHPDWLRSSAARDALDVLDSLPDPSSAELLSAAATWRERIRAAEMRQRMRETGLAPLLSLTAALRSPNPLIREAVAVALVHAPQQGATAALVEALSDASLPVRHAAAVALHGTDWQPEAEEQYASLLVALGRYKAAAEFGAAGVEALLALPSSADPATQAAAVESLAAARTIRAMPRLVALLDSPHAPVREAAARALKALEWVPPTGAQAIAHAMALGDWSAAAAQGHSAVDALITALKRSVGDADRSAALRTALASISDPDAVPELLKYSRDGEVAAAVISALQSLLDHSGDSMPDAALATLAVLPDAAQFRFAFDERYARHVRAGIETVGTAAIREKAASIVAARRQAGVAAAAGTEGDAP